jgi:cellulose synthase/poly-beta-1,6-N-acetylglucosamine synthase-like glycosyltransferase
MYSHVSFVSVEVAKMVDVSIIVPFRDAERTLADCLQGFLTLDHGSFELILVNNLSMDRSRQIAADFAATYGRKFRIIVVDEKKPGAAASRNRGVVESRGRFLAFTDADCVVSPSWLSQMMIGFDRPVIGAVAGNIKGYRPSGVIEAFHSVFTLQTPPAARVFNRFDILTGGFPAANLTVRREVFSEVEGFDEDFQISGEDYDLCARIYSAGHQIKFVPQASVYHIHRRKLRTTWRQGFGFGLSHARLWKRYRDDLLVSLVGNRGLKSRGLPMRGWIELSTADKKLIYLLVLTAIFWPAVLILPFYAFYLAADIAGRCKAQGVAAAPLAHMAMAGLLIFKSAAMTAGRMAGSIKYGVICL